MATNNPGKQREFMQLLVGWGGEIAFPRDLGLDLEVEEGGASFEENAILKARAYAAASGLPSLADEQQTIVVGQTRFTPDSEASLRGGGGGLTGGTGGTSPGAPG